jgi:hypothetical protein
MPTKTRKVKKGSKNSRVKIYNLNATLTNDEIKAKEGTYFDGKDFTIIDHDADVYGLFPDGSKQLLAKFRKGVFDKPITDLAWESFYRLAAPSRSRGAAAGPIDPKSEYWKKRKIVENKGWWATYKNGNKTSKMRVNNTVFSSVVGYFEKTPFMKLPCRLTSYTQTFFDQYKKGIPFIQAIDKVFKDLTPGPYQKQLDRIKKTPKYRIEDTAFSSVTVNRNFRTALHQDAGDFKDGYGNLTVLERGKYHGGYTLFPQFSVGFDLRMGDFLAMDVHQWHCNTEMFETPEDKAFNKTLEPIKYYKTKTGAQGSDKTFSRISFVCYVREGLADCDAKLTDKYYKRIGFKDE